MHPIIDFTNNVETVENAGGQVPADYTAILNRWHAYQELERPNQAALINAVIDPKNNADLGSLRALALAEAVTPVQAADLSNPVQHAVYQALITAYRPVAESNYVKIAKAWNVKAAEFTKYADIIDPATLAERLMHAKDDVRNAWSKGQTLNAELSASMAPVIAAADLAGMRVGNAPGLFGLFAKPDTEDTHGAWAAWNSDSRWVDLHKAGIRIEASTLKDHEPYSLPTSNEVASPLEINGKAVVKW